MSLFQRIKSPFLDGADEYPAVPHPRANPVGMLLRERREELGLDLGSIGETLRIKPVYLAALEQGRAQDLPGPAYAIGFVRAYAHYLGFDIDRVLERYKAESAEVHARPDLTLPVPLSARSVPGGPILLVGLILALCGYGTWYYLSTGERSRPEPVAAVPAELRQPPREGAAVAAHPDAVPAPGSAAAASASRLRSGIAAAPDAAASSEASSGDLSPAGAPTAAASAPPRAATPPAGRTAAVPQGSAASTAAGSIDIRALADCWIQVRSADQSIVFSRVLKAGETYHVPRTGLSLRTGNAGALAVAVDGKPAPTLGGIGTLRRNVALDPEALLAGTAVKG